MRRWWLSLVAVLGLAQASPALELFKEASFYLEFYYYGPSRVSPKELIPKYQARLEQACAPLGNTCSFAIAQPLIEQMLNELRDGHTYYLSPRTYAASMEQLEGRVEVRPMIGLEFGPSNSRGETLIAEVYADSPAQVAGLQPGDRIVSVNGQSSVLSLRSLLDTDAPVRLGIARGSSDNPLRLEVTVQRKPMAVLELPYMYRVPEKPQVFVIRIPQFATYNQVGPRVHALVRQAQAQNAQAILVDLRGNGGGEETECVSAVGAFVGNYQIFMQGKHNRYPLGFNNGQVIGNDPRDLRTYRIDPPALWTGKVATLVNLRSASCAELFAYLLQRYGKGPVVGERTLGVLNTATDYFPLIDQSAIAITYIQTLNNDGSPFPALVQPDVIASDSAVVWSETGRDRLVDRALEALGLR